MGNKDLDNNNVDINNVFLEFEKELGTMLDEYDVEYPSETEMMMTINSLRPYVPVKVNNFEVFYGSIYSILKNALHEVFYISPLFWISNCLFLLISLSTVFIVGQNPYIIMLILAPFPILTGLFEVFKSRESGMAELEMSFKYSLQELILSRMFVIGGFNFLINLTFTMCISIFYPEIWLWKLVLYWVTPFTVITAIMLVVVTKFRHIYAVTAGLLVWISFGAFISQANMIEKIESIPVAFYILVIVFATIVVFTKLKRIYKRGITYEFNH